MWRIWSNVENITTGDNPAPLHSKHPQFDIPSFYMWEMADSLTAELMEELDEDEVEAWMECGRPVEIRHAQDEQMLLEIR